jgi:hypothetical protein
VSLTGSDSPGPGVPGTVPPGDLVGWSPFLTCCCASTVSHCAFVHSQLLQHEESMKDLEVIAVAGVGGRDRHRQVKMAAECMGAAAAAACKHCCCQLAMAGQAPRPQQ